MPSAPLWSDTQIEDSPWAANSGPRPPAIVPSRAHHILWYGAPWGPQPLPWTEPGMGTRPWPGGSQVPACRFPAPSGFEPSSLWTPPYLKEQNLVRCESAVLACTHGGLGARPVGTVGWTGPAHSPSPKKIMRFLAAVWMGCSFLAVSRAWAAWRFQKAGSSSSTGRGERGSGQPWGAPCVWGAAGRHLVTWDDAEGEP